MPGLDAEERSKGARSMDIERQEYFLTALWDILTLPYSETCRKYNMGELLDSVETAMIEIETEKHRRTN